MDLHEFIFKKLNNKENYYIAFHDMEVSISHSIIIQGIRYSTQLVIDKMNYFNDDAKWSKLDKHINAFIKQSTSIEKLFGN